MNISIKIINIVLHLLWAGGGKDTLSTQLTILMFMDQVSLKDVPLVWAAGDAALCFLIIIKHASS